MEQRLEKILDSTSILQFEEGMVGISATQNMMVIRARFIWKEERWWHLLIHPPTYQPVWLRIKPSALGDWTPDLNDPATAGIILNRVSSYHGQPASFDQSFLILGDGRTWKGETRIESIKISVGT